MIDSQRWVLHDSERELTGKGLALHLTSHLIGVGLEDFEWELRKAEGLIKSTHVGDTIADKYGQQFERIQ